MAAGELLVGSTGFVGGNLRAAHAFGALAHSADVAAQYGTRPELCVYAGVPAAMFLANADPEADLAVMRAARENLRRIAPKKVVLISTIAVFADSRGADEHTVPSPAGLPAYGANRLRLEQWVREDFPDCLIVRLPALYGRGLKKNFLYDLHSLSPALLRPDKYAALAAQSALVARAYSPAGNGFYQQNGSVDPAALRAFFAANDFNALSFTDSRSRYQFYFLGRLWDDIALALQNGLTLLHLATPPLTAGAVHAAVTGRTGWRNELPRPPFDYDLRTVHAGLFPGGDAENGYLCTAERELADIRAFMAAWGDR